MEDFMVDIPMITMTLNSTLNTELHIIFLILDIGHIGIVHIDYGIRLVIGRGKNLDV